MTKERGRIPRPGAQEVRPSTRGSWAQRRVSSVQLVTPCMRKRLMTRLVRVRREPMAAPGAACLALAWRHRDRLLAR
jgi:hypothetical protein